MNWGVKSASRRDWASVSYVRFSLRRGDFSYLASRAIGGIFLIVIGTCSLVEIATLVEADPVFDLVDIICIGDFV